MEAGKHSDLTDSLSFFVCEWRQGHCAHCLWNCRFSEDTFAIAELFESFVSSVASIAAVTNATETLVVTKNLEQAVI